VKWNNSLLLITSPHRHSIPRLFNFSWNNELLPGFSTTEYTGAPSKAHTRQLVKIQHEERLATTSELNPTPSLATD